MRWYLLSGNFPFGFIRFEWNIDCESEIQKEKKKSEIVEKARSNHQSAQNNGDIYHGTCFYFHDGFHIFE